MEAINQISVTDGEVYHSEPMLGHGRTASLPYRAVLATSNVEVADTTSLASRRQSSKFNFPHFFENRVFLRIVKVQAKSLQAKLTEFQFINTNSQRMIPQSPTKILYQQRCLFSQVNVLHIFPSLSLLFALFNCFAAMKLNTVLLYVILYLKLSDQVIRHKWQSSKIITWQDFVSPSRRDRVFEYFSF